MMSFTNLLSFADAVLNYWIKATLATKAVTTEKVWGKKVQNKSRCGNFIFKQKADQSNKLHGPGQIATWAKRFPWKSRGKRKI